MARPTTTAGKKLPTPPAPPAVNQKPNTPQPPTRPVSVGKSAATVPPAPPARLNPPQQPPARETVPVQQPPVPENPGAMVARTHHNESLSTNVVDLAADAVAYQDEFAQSSLQIPFLQIIQSNSPQIKPGNSAFIEGAQMGMFFNTVTRDIFDGLTDGLEVVPVYHYATFIEWILREQGGGFVKDAGMELGTRMLQQCKKNEKGQDILPNGHQLVRTETYFILIILAGDEGGVVAEPAMFTLTSTGLKKARNWNSRIMAQKATLPNKQVVTAPMFFNTYILKTVPERNEKGEWYGVVVEDGQPTLNHGDAIYLEARKFRQTAQHGTAAGTFQVAPQPGTTEDMGGGTGPGNEDIPF